MRPSPAAIPEGVDRYRDACPNLTTYPGDAYKTVSKAFLVWAEGPTRSVFPPVASRHAGEPDVAVQLEAVQEAEPCDSGGFREGEATSREASGNRAAQS